MKPVDFSCSYNGFCKIKETGKDLRLEEYARQYEQDANGVIEHLQAMQNY